jgi:gamma-glutamylcyclotransferase (GGCT)/AIG2-like uncharacterized protein YtfP
MIHKNVMLFVYGTLRSDASPSNAHLLGGILLSSRATVRGTLYDFGHYPGIVLNEFAGEVVGELWSVPKAQLSRLDHYEGSEYARVVTEATMPGGSTVTVMVYEAFDVDGLDKIPGNDWTKREVSEQPY